LRFCTLLNFRWKFLVDKIATIFIHKRWQQGDSLKRQNREEKNINERGNNIFRNNNRIHKI
jgi:hypothetical protein